MAADIIILALAMAESVVWLMRFFVINFTFLCYLFGMATSYARFSAPICA